MSREKKFGLSVLTIVGAAVVATAANDYLVPNGGVSPSIVIGAGILFAAALREIWRR